jgi:hypothetical protein
MTTRSRRSALTACILCVVVSGSAAAGQNPFRRAPKAEYLAFKDPAGQFSLEYPKDWQVLPGAGDVIATFAQKNGEAALVIERSRLSVALKNPEEVTDLFIQIETDALKERQPKATDVTGKLVLQGGRRLIVVDYSRPGLVKPERVRQYSMPQGPVLFRLTCSTATALFTKYDPMFVHVAESLNVQAPAATSGTGSK